MQAESSDFPLLAKEMPIRLAHFAPLGNGDAIPSIAAVATPEMLLSTTVTVSAPSAATLRSVAFPPAARDVRGNEERAEC
jgi:hypothetical protein